MAGYSATPQARKLGLKSGLRFATVAAPAGWDLDEPPHLEAAAEGEGSTDVLLHFVRSAAEIPSAVESAAPRIFSAGALWVAWPRKAARHVSDVTENAIRDAALARGLVDVKVAAIDEDWSGLKIVWRKELRKS